MVGGHFVILATPTGIFFPTNTVAITAKPKPSVIASIFSPNSGMANSRLKNGWTSWTWLTRTAPPKANPRYQAKKPSHMEKTAT